MPRLVAHQLPWHFSATTVCVGPGEYPRALEWELRSGATSADLTSLPDWAKTLTQHQTGEGDRISSECHPCFLRSKIWRAEAQKPRQRSHSAANITSERAKAFWNIRPRLKSTKNWSSDSHRSSRLHFEWKASGLTVLSFWIVPVIPLFVGDAGTGRSREVQAFSWTPHWPD